ncbi:ParB/RepB/Spo0J family partition protein [Gammaproteobacteria bacterium]|nr:chromosome partitioning protein ParB [Paracoccaceae bacterium]MDA7786611.1 ParB/RepB/Spo0J family partition protein [Gammaproteobacteria bacterium]MDA7818792.1 ParB/RepB/Spo0J family partition protein [Gammaproteobacteria bacterium]MDA7856580.1 ParB/RepB/Spo0J family partition protein [Gammaproteobacteria bacterium]MDA8957698.1 ParB/RepB/Spo0J family partition protein [Gammaproteobacteria bacterium]|tara:strand:- start:2802 stop:3653 length:852 start_codon:yes stop_codon:yes gene_type:complete
MSDNKKTLNRGLDALLGSRGKPKRTIQDVNLTQINAGRFQPREVFDEESLKELTDSIKKHGVISPILVRELGLNKYEVIAGERRMRASIQAGLETIPCLVDQKEDQDALESALIENLQREDLNAVEEARGYDRLKREFGLTQDEVATSTGKARSTIANSLRILSLPQKVLDFLSAGKIEKGHAKLLASMEPKDAEIAAENIINNKLTVKDLSESSRNQKKGILKKEKQTDVLLIEQEMSEAFGHQITVEAKTKQKGSLQISYKTSDELETIISKILSKNNQTN